MPAEQNFTLLKKCRFNTETELVEVRFNPTPTFLGVTFRRTLSFSKHVSSLKAKFSPRLKALRCISAF